MSHNPTRGTQEMLKTMPQSKRQLWGDLQIILWDYNDFPFPLCRPFWFCGLGDETLPVKARGASPEMVLMQKRILSLPLMLCCRAAVFPLPQQHSLPCIPAPCPVLASATGRGWEKEIGSSQQQEDKQGFRSWWSVRKTLELKLAEGGRIKNRL